MSVLIAQTAMLIPGVDPSQFKALGSGGNPRKCWLHRENKDTHPANPEWNHWPSRIYFQRKGEPLKRSFVHYFRCCIEVH